MGQPALRLWGRPAPEAGKEPILKIRPHHRAGHALPHEPQDHAVESKVLLAARAGGDVALDLGALLGRQLMIQVGEDADVDFAAARV